MKSESELVHWADSVAKRVIAQKGDKEKYVVASGITPSGTIHIGNFREIITVDLVARALRDRGKEVRFIYSWDDYDVFRKVPKNMPKQEMLKKHLRKPIVDIPDPFGTEESYARHNEVEIESVLPVLDINPEFIYQSKKYRNCDYSDGIITALKNFGKIKDILDKYRKEPLSSSWLPLSGYDPEKGDDLVEFSDFDGDHKVKIKRKAESDWHEINIREAPFLKLPWRVDWPMRWAYEKVDFEPGGKEHSTVGGSYTTAKEIVKLYDWEAPVYEKYDFITVKGAGGKISSSLGNVITIKDCLEIYEPAMLRWLFAGTRPGTEFAISFDLDVVKLYEDFDKCERIYYKKESAKEKEYLKQKRIYELSCVGELKKDMPYQPSFRHLTTVLLICSFDVDKTLEYYSDELSNDADKQRLRLRAECAKNWIEKYAPEEFRFSINDRAPDDLNLSSEMKTALHSVADFLASNESENIDAVALHNKFYDIVNQFGVDSKDFFKACYRIMIGKEKGPKLANFILMIGKEKVFKLFKSL